MTQLTSHVAPPSGENDCSQRHVVGDVRPDEADEDRPAVERVLGDERPDAVLEAADDGRIEAARVAAVEPPDRPLVRVGVERAERDRPVRAGGQLEDVVVDVAGPTEERPGDRGALELFPLVVVGEALLEAAVMDPPRAHVEVEVVDRGARFGAGRHGEPSVQVSRPL